MFHSEYVYMYIAVTCDNADKNVTLTSPQCAAVCHCHIAPATPQPTATVLVVFHHFEIQYIPAQEITKT
jgi:hypothetical protein